MSSVRSLTLGFSPCPNDTFIFGPLATGLLNIPGVKLNITHADVETLNQFAMQNILDLTKISLHAFGHVCHRYVLLRSGAALGRGCGPMLVAREPRTMESLRGQAIAVPGELTTANLLLQLCGDGFSRVHHLSYETIMPRLQHGEFAAGVIIHEGRFTYHNYGLHEVLDLGKWWEETQNLPVPLGAILARRDLEPRVVEAVEESIRQSLLLSRKNVKAVWPYIKRHAQEMNDTVIWQHIDLYVNDHTVDVGEEGRRAIEKMLQLAVERGILPPVPKKLFYNE
jgi:1,4-dihydroxy-6-naphthoate synthase